MLVCPSLLAYEPAQTSKYRREVERMYVKPQIVTYTEDDFDLIEVSCCTCQCVCECVCKCERT